MTCLGSTALQTVTFLQFLQNILVPPRVARVMAFDYLVERLYACTRAKD